MKEYNEYLQIVTDAISNLRLPGQPSGLYDPIRYTLNCGGKRLRPVLALAACEAFGKEAMTAIHQAIAIEMFHNFTLLHDKITPFFRLKVPSTMADLHSSYSLLCQFPKASRKWHGSRI